MVRDILEFPEVLPKKTNKQTCSHIIYESAERSDYSCLWNYTLSNWTSCLKTSLPDNVKLTSFRECWLPEAPPSMPSAPICREKTHMWSSTGIWYLSTFFRETHIFANMIFVSMYCICLFICYKSWKSDINAESQRLEEGSYLNLIFTPNVTNMSFQVPWDMNQLTLCPFISLVRRLGLPCWHSG